MRPLWLALVLLACTVCAHAQTDYSSLTFHYVKAGLPVPEYRFTVTDAWGSYEAHGQGDGAVTTQDLKLTSAMRGRLFNLIHQAGNLQACDSHRKGMADTGAKTLIYHEAYKGDMLSCTYNYSDSKAITELTQLFQGMAFTLDEGRKLEREHRYDRLALDAEMNVLVEAIKAGSALEPGNIAATLRSLADDIEVMERVRVRALKLLEMAPHVAQTSAR